MSSRNRNQVIARDTTVRTNRSDGTFVPDYIVLRQWSWYQDLFTQTSVGTPGFRKLKRKMLPLNPYYQRSDLVLYGYGSATHAYQNSTPGSISYTDTYTGPATAFYADVSQNAYQYPEDDPSSLAIAKLQSDVSLSAGNLMVTMAEAHKTASHIAHTATRLANAYRDLRSLRFGDFLLNLGLTATVKEERALRNRWRFKSSRGWDTRQFAANTWLEYSYGWKPLLSDIFAQAKNFATVLSDHQFIVREARGKAKTEKVYTENFLDRSSLWANKKTVQVQSKVIYIVRYKIPNGETAVANVFGLVNPLSVAWELVPFSFVADWFIPIGSFLEGLTAYGGLAFANGTRTGQRIVHVTCDSSPGPGTSNSSVREFSSISMQSTGEYRELKRTVLDGFPAQGIPEFKDPRSFAHATSAIALLQSVFVGSQRGSIKLR